MLFAGLRFGANDHLSTHVQGLFSNPRDAD